MRIPLLLSALLLWGACREKPVVSIESFRKEKGTDCDQPDTLRTNCARIDLQYPVLKSGPQALRDSAGSWVNSYLFGMLAPESEQPVSSLDEAAQAFFANHETFRESVMYGAFEAQCGGEVALDDDKHLTLAMSGYTYQGGAHGSSNAAVATFDVATGRQLRWPDLIADLPALKKLLEQKFRQAKAEAFRDGFNFDTTFPFELPQNFGLTPTGIYCVYNPYEVAPYALGSTEIDLTFDEIQSLLKK